LGNITREQEKENMFITVLGSVKTGADLAAIERCADSHLAAISLIS